MAIPSRIPKVRALVSERRVGWVVLNTLLVTLLYVTLIVFGVNSSSVTLLSSSGQPGVDLVRGTPRLVRTDEYLRGTPAALGAQRARGVPDRGTPLDYGGSVEFQNAQKSVIGAIRPYLALDYLVFSRVADSLPANNGFAAYWWLYSWMLLVFLPWFLRLLRVQDLLSVLGGWVVWLSPAIAWWSLWSAVPLALAALAGTTFLVAYRLVEGGIAPTRARWVGALVLALVAATVAARLPFTYQPWALPVGIVFFAIILGATVSAGPDRARRVALLGVGLVSSALLTGLFLLQERSLFATLADTVYPGTRRFEGAATIVPIWSGTTNWALQHPVGDGLVASNPSEVATGFLIATFFAVAALPVSRRLLPSTIWLPAALGTGAVLLLLAWIIAPWPPFLLNYNPLVLLPGTRVLQILAPLSLLVYVMGVSLVLRVPARQSVRRIALVLFVPLLVLSVIDASGFRLGFLPGYSATWVWLMSALVVAALALPFVYRSSYALIPLFVLAILFVYKVNPIMAGAGDLGESPAMETVIGAIGEDNGRWATDTMRSDALVIAAGARMLSGQQGTGPNREAWKILDPAEAYSSVWNRGASYLLFAWNDSDIPALSNPAPDVIQVTVSPCSPVMQALELRWVLTAATLSQDCLERRGELLWQGVPMNLYAVR